MQEQRGEFVIQTRLYLTPENRAKLERLVRDCECDVADVISDIVSAHLDPLPTISAAPASHPPDHTATLSQRRAELVRLRARRATEGNNAPAWLDGYIADLEDEIRRGKG
jgi:hypothetical protein